MKIRMTHAELQSAAVTLAHHLGWKHLHVRRSIGKGRAWVTATNVVGWPDLLLWSPRHPGRFIAVEVKVPPDDLRPEQREVLAELAASGMETWVLTEEWLDAFARVLAPRRGDHYHRPAPRTKGSRR